MDLFASRDLDSRFSRREAAAVADWLAAKGSRSLLHCMRDHPHHGVAMVGSAWGARMDLGAAGTAARRRWRRAWRNAARRAPGKMFADRREYGADQEFLYK